MSLPKKIKKHLPLIPEVFGHERREQLLGEVTNDGTFLPKGVLHSDLDRGMLDFVKESLRLEIDGKTVPTVDKIITNQNWSQFTETWNFQDLDKNISLPFIATIRQPEVKYGTFQGGAANIPNRRQFFYYTVPTWDGQRNGADVYKIPQPIPVDLKFNIKLFCNRMRELNDFNLLVMQKFTSKQSYAQIKGHYIPIILDDVSDEGIKELEKRKYYIANYSLTMKGILIDEDEFQISPAISRSLTMMEVDLKKKSKRVTIEPPRPNFFDLELKFVSGVTQLSEVFRYSVDLKINSFINLSSCNNISISAITSTTLNYTGCTGSVQSQTLFSGNTTNVCVKNGTTVTFNPINGGIYNQVGICGNKYSVYINGNFLGDNIPIIQINDGDTLLIIVYKLDNSQTSTISTTAYLV